MPSSWLDYLEIVSTVLLIDDSKFLRRANELSLAKAGHQIITASDGEEGLRLASPGEKAGCHCPGHAVAQTGRGTTS
jgi:hypothetical protein